jgi:hypothetical protein
MPAPKGLTKQLPLRMTDEERALLAEVQQVYGAHGVEMSLNDTARHLIRRAGIILAHTPGESTLQLREHCDGCEHCDMRAESFKCPEGLFLYRNHRRVLRAHPGTNEADGL